MIVITDVIDAKLLETLRTGLQQAPFADGKATAGVTAREVKSNQQADAADPKVKELAGLVRQALDRNTLFQAYTRPARLTGVMFNRYGVGDTYGMHVDEPVMGRGARMRTDFSYTLFLSDPESYEGGELTVAATEGARKAKPKAGSMVVYSTGDLHRVQPVTKGERLAAVGWVQSLIRGAQERAILFDLARVRTGMATGDSRLLLDKAIGNLVRLWGEP
jgi:PKHD-type hydroxylase